MINYKDILNDPTIIKEYQIIDKINNFYMSHGLKHINNVINICQNLATILNLSPKDKNNLLIAAALHDIGASTGRQDHANKSAEFAKKYLKDKLSEKDIDIIYNIIKRHSWNSPKNNLLEVLCCVADKIDFTKDRLEYNYREKYGFTSVLENITAMTFEIKANTLIFRIIVNNNLTIEQLCTEKKRYDEGIKYNISSLAKRLNIDYEIYFGNKLFTKSKGRN